MRVKQKRGLAAYLCYFCLELNCFAALRYKVPLAPLKLFISSSS
jgi:hypothetical protein